MAVRGKSENYRKGKPSARSEHLRCQPYFSIRHSDCEREHSQGTFFVAKQELSKVPILGQYMHIMGMIFVDRGNREKAIQSMEIAAKKVKKARI